MSYNPRNAIFSEKKAPAAVHHTHTGHQNPRNAIFPEKKAREASAQRHPWVWTQGTQGTQGTPRTQTDAMYKGDTQDTREPRDTKATKGTNGTQRTQVREDPVSLCGPLCPFVSLLSLFAQSNLMKTDENELVL